MPRRLPLPAVLLASLTLAACSHAPRPEPAPAPAAQPAPPPAPMPTAAAPAPAPKDDSAERAAREAAATLAERIHFDFDKSDLRGADQAILDRKLPVLAGHASLRIRVEGHCDERGSDEYNLALGMRRASEAKRYLVGHGIAGDRIEVVSYGRERPLDPGHDESAWAQNRRDEFVTLSGTVALR